MKKTVLLGVILCSMMLAACGGGNGGKDPTSKVPTSTSQTTKGPYTVKFDTNGGAETIEDQIVQHNGYATKPTDPTRNDPVKGAYQFLGWYDSDNAIWSFELSKVTKNITLKAKWNDKYTVTFSGVEGALATQYINRGEALTKPADPTAPSGKTFYGWRATNNGGQIWDFEDKQLKLVMQDLTFEPLFIDSSLQAQALEGELCPNILTMKGATYSGGSQGRGMTARDSHSSINENPLKASGNYIWDENQEARYATESDEYEKTFGGFVHNMHIQGNFLEWEFTASEAASNVVLAMRACAEYGLDGQDGELVCAISDQKCKVYLNNELVEYGNLNIHNVIFNKYFTFQDYVLNTNVSLKKGTNTLKFLVDNNDFVGSGNSLVAQAPVFDCFKLFTSSTIEWADADISVMDK